MFRLVSLALILAPIPAFAARTAQTLPADFVPPEGVVEIVDKTVAEMLAPSGNAALDWQRQGVDLIAHIDAAAGGRDSNVVVTEPDGDQSVILYGSGTLPTPTGTEPLLDMPRRPVSGEVHWQRVTRLDDELWMRTRTRLSRRENALCGYGWETLTILAVSDAPLFGEPLTLALVYALVAERLGRFEICVIAFEQPDRTFLLRSFLPDGRPLPGLDKRARPVRIRPLADAHAVLTP